MSSTTKKITLGEIAAALGQEKPQRADLEFSGVNSLTDADESEVSFLASDQYYRQFATTRAGLVLVPRKTALPDNPKPIVFRMDDVDLAMVKVLSLFAPPVQRPEAGVDPSARISGDTALPADASVGPCVTIGRRVRMGARCQIHAGAVIGDEVKIGNDCTIHANVVIRERITIGNRVTINAGSVLGTDGFGYRWDGQQHVKVPQIGTVIIEDDVEIGSCVCIDRAKFGATVIGRGTKIDNLVQIAHNVKVGPHCLMAGQTGIAGSTTIGAGVVFGGASSVRDHVSLGDGVIVAARSAVHEDVPPRTVVSGMPALPHRQTLREQAAFRKLPELIVQVRKFQDRIEEHFADKNSDEDVLGQ